MVNEFFIDLISNTSSNFYPGNNISKFTTKLNSPLDLQGTWVVGIAEVFYPITVFNVENRIRVGLAYVKRASNVVSQETPMLSTSSRKYYLDRGHYKSVKDIIDDLNEALTKLWSERTEFKNVGGKAPHLILLLNSYVRLEYGIVTEGANNYLIYPTFQTQGSDDLEKMLGFLPKQIPRRTASVELTKPVIQSFKNPDLRAGKNFILIYCDIIHDRHIGDDAAPLLRTVPLSRGHFDDIGYMTFNKPFYHCLSRNRIESISILLCDEEGNQLHFASGRVNIVLHFKKVQ